MTSAEWEEKVYCEECTCCVHEHDNWGFNKHCEECYKQRKQKQSNKIAIATMKF